MRFWVRLLKVKGPIHQVTFVKWLCVTFRRKGSGEEANNVFLAVAPEFHTDSGKRSVRVEVRLFLWQGGYFDYVSSVFASRPQSIAFFNANSADFLVVANFQDDTGSTSVYSEIFHYQQKNSKFVPFQRIRTYGAKDIKYFSLSSGHTKKEHFLAVANHCQIGNYVRIQAIYLLLLLRVFFSFRRTWEEELQRQVIHNETRFPEVYSFQKLCNLRSSRVPSCDGRNHTFFY